MPSYRTIYAVNELDRIKKFQLFIVVPLTVRISVFYDVKNPDT